MNFIFYFIVKKLLKIVSTPIDIHLVSDYILDSYTNIGGGGGIFHSNTNNTGKTTLLLLAFGIAGVGIGWLWGRLNAIHLNFDKKEKNNENEVKNEKRRINYEDLQFIQKIDIIINDKMAYTDFRVEDITKELGISRTKLHLQIKSITGMSIMEYVTNKRIEKACKLLAQGYKVKETAYRSGYSDPNYFSKIFKKNKGVSPTEWQKNIVSKVSHCHKKDETLE